VTFGACVLAKLQRWFAMPLSIIEDSSLSTTGNPTKNSEIAGESANANIGAVAVFPRLIDSREKLTDCCPHCRIRLEIVSVKFKFGSVAMIASCPNCAIAVDWRTAEWETFNKLSASCCELLGRGISFMDPLSFRFRYFVAILFVTVLIAGVLRHVFHVYGGFSREEIRAGALMAIPAIALAIMFFQGKHQR
jgi:hypothetical protein